MEHLVIYGLLNCLGKRVAHSVGEQPDGLSLALSQELRLASDSCRGVVL